MVNPTLLNWVNQQKSQRSELEIKNDLLRVGWKEIEVQEALAMVYGHKNTAPGSRKRWGRWCCFFSCLILLFLVAVASAWYFYRFFLAGEKTETLPWAVEQVIEQAAEDKQQAERDKIVGGSDVWREEMATKKYHVKSSHAYLNQGPSTMTKMEITMALIPNVSGYQAVITEKINPAVYEVVTDDSGNKFAEFTINKRVAPGGKYEFGLDYQVQVQAFKNHLGVCAGKKINDFLQAEQYLEVDDWRMKKIASEITAGKNNDCEKAEAIYDYVGDNMQYRLSGKGEMGGALFALENKTGDCTYFADLFIALSRAAGIPARFLEGVTYAVQTDEHTTTPSNKHDWAEVYLPGTGWTPVDPTWGREGYNRFQHFSQTDGQHIILTRGRNVSALAGWHYFHARYWYEGATAPKTDLVEKWEVELVN